MSTLDNLLFDHVCRLNLLKPDKQKKAKAEGYKEGATTLFQQMNASDFIRTSDLATVLADVNEVC